MMPGQGWCDTAEMTHFPLGYIFKPTLRRMMEEVTAGSAPSLSLSGIQTERKHDIRGYNVLHLTGLMK